MGISTVLKLLVVLLPWQRANRGMQRLHSCMAVLRVTLSICVWSLFMSLVWHGEDRAEGQRWLRASTLPDLSSVTVRVTSIVTLKQRASCCVLSRSSLRIPVYLSSTMYCEATQWTYCVVALKYSFRNWYLIHVFLSFDSDFWISNTAFVSCYEIWISVPNVPALKLLFYPFSWIIAGNCIRPSWTNDMKSLPCIQNLHSSYSSSWTMRLTIRPTQ